MGNNLQVAPINTCRYTPTHARRGADIINLRDGSVVTHNSINEAKRASRKMQQGPGMSPGCGIIRVLPHKQKRQGLSKGHKNALKAQYFARGLAKSMRKRKRVRDTKKPFTGADIDALLHRTGKHEE